MAINLDWSQCPVVESIPGKVSGAWVFRDTRVPVSAIFENLKTSPIEEILENFHVTRDQVQTLIGNGYDQDFSQLLLLQAKASGIELKSENVDVGDGLS